MRSKSNSAAGKPSKKNKKNDSTSDTLPNVQSTQSREQIIEAHHLQQEVSKRMINNGFTFRNSNQRSKEQSVANMSMEDSSQKLNIKAIAAEQQSQEEIRTTDLMVAEKEAFLNMPEEGHRSYEGSSRSSGIHYDYRSS